MSQENKPSLVQKWKDGTINRAAVVTALILVVAIAVVVSVTVASNRSKKNEAPAPSDKPSVTQPVESPEDTKPPVEDNTPTDKTPESTAPSTDVEDKLPSFILPVSGALSKKHDPKLQVFSQTMNDYRVHLGVDIVTAENAPVYAAADGKVSRVWKDTLMGYCVAVAHSGDSYTIYKNLSETLAEGIVEGTSVRSGQLLGTVGNSAMVEVGEEPHLHFEMTVADLLVDPLQYFDEQALQSLSIDASFGE